MQSPKWFPSSLLTPGLPGVVQSRYYEWMSMWILPGTVHSAPLNFSLIHDKMAVAYYVFTRVEDLMLRGTGLVVREINFL
jgi:hypothetical protein